MTCVKDAVVSLLAFTFIFNVVFRICIYYPLTYGFKTTYSVASEPMLDQHAIRVSILLWSF